MAKQSHSEAPKRPTIEDIRSRCKVRRMLEPALLGPREMAPVRVLRRTMDNGVMLRPGDEIEMELSLVPPHVAAGVVELIEETDGAK